MSREGGCGTGSHDSFVKNISTQTRMCAHTQGEREREREREKRERERERESIPHYEALRRSEGRLPRHAHLDQTPHTPLHKTHHNIKTSKSEKAKHHLSTKL